MSATQEPAEQCVVLSTQYVPVPEHEPQLLLDEICSPHATLDAAGQEGVHAATHWPPEHVPELLAPTAAEYCF